MEVNAPPTVAVTARKLLGRCVHSPGESVASPPPSTSPRRLPAHAISCDHPAQDRSFWNLQTFFKVAALSFVEYDVVCVQDLDMVQLSDPLRWMLRDRRSSSAELLGCSNHPEPFNAGLFCVRPRRESYHAMVDLVANGSFSYTSGWSLESPPPVSWARQLRELIPWLREPSPWRFPGAAVEQGLFYHYFTKVRPPGSFVRPHDCTVGAMQERKLNYHFLGERKPWMLSPYTSKTALGTFISAHKGGFCHWWRALTAAQPPVNSPHALGRCYEQTQAITSKLGNWSYAKLAGGCALLPVVCPVCASAGATLTSAFSPCAYFCGSCRAEVLRRGGVQASRTPEEAHAKRPETRQVG